MKKARIPEPYLWQIPNNNNDCVCVVINILFPRVNDHIVKKVTRHKLDSVHFTKNDSFVKYFSVKKRFPFHEMDNFSKR